MLCKCECASQESEIAVCEPEAVIFFSNTHWPRPGSSIVLILSSVPALCAGRPAHVLLLTAQARELNQKKEEKRLAAEAKKQAGYHWM